ncbi:MAG: glycoside hydrolase family 3 C-terminal domain-containing protein [Cyclobacteriaceae bacterium]
MGRNSGEGYDRVETDDFLLTTTEKEMISNATNAFHQAGKPVVVVLNIGGVIETASWNDQPDAILLAWQGGQEGGNSVADILSGKTNPSGKLPMTFPIRLEDHASNANFVRNKDYTNYEEGVYVGYRHFDKAGLQVAYPFGYGLTYTSFGYDSAEIYLADDSIHVSILVTNTGETSGKEVVQIYASKPNSNIDRPQQELKAFGKTRLLNPGESATLEFTIPVSELRYWDEVTSGWKLENGTYAIRIGSSSRDIRQESQIDISI